MKKSQNSTNMREYSGFSHQKTQYPLVNVIDFSKSTGQAYSHLYFGHYCIISPSLDDQGSNLTFISPNNMVGLEHKITPSPSSRQALVFHPDFILGTSLENTIRAYGFFDYLIDGKLRLSPTECQLVFDCFAKIKAELHQPIDQHSHTLISSIIELLLNYCRRFHHASSTTKQVNHGIMEKFETLLNRYFTSEDPATIGLPSVAYFADKLHLSPNYFGDLIKKETGKTPREFIQNKIIDLAKNRIFGTAKSISEIAYDLGFKYPQHFMRLFKNQVGYTPNEYRNLN